MFENIQFSTVFRDFSINSTDLKNTSDNELIKISENSRQAISGEFMLSGNTSILMEYPMTRENMEHYIYIQSFSYMDMQGCYYTRRKNYDSFLLLYTYSGQGCLEYNGQTYDLQAGSCFFIDCNSEHNYYLTGDRWEHSDLHINGGNIRHIYYEYFENKNHLFQITSQDEFQHKLESLLLYHCKISVYRDYLVHSAMNDLLTYLLQHCQDTSSTKIPDPISNLARYLSDNFTDDISLDAMSSFCGLSKYHLVREFSRYMHFTPHDYVNELRIAQAKRLLIDTDIPAYKIGVLVGISNEANFIRLFKQKTEVSPGTYRRNFK